MKKINFFLKKHILPYIVFVIYKIWSMTWKIHIEEGEDLKYFFKKKQAVIFAHWHGDEIVLLKMISKYKTITMVSTSEDGNLMNKLVYLAGGETTRGSSTRNSISATKGLIKLANKTKKNISMAVDGPKGPVYQIKPGVFQLSRMLKMPVFVAGIACNKKISFSKSWNKTYIPYPFAHVWITWKGPFFVLKESKENQKSLLDRTVFSLEKKQLKEIFDAANRQSNKQLLDHT